ncbi:MAG: antibiotic biosynthesis monooxygenase [Acidothermus cellulolyticus]|nr:antibiotic biosynthesis monooxygenase [Acidothermus cellulolyticus]
MIARMWEARIHRGQLDEFCVWVRDAAWPQYRAAPGFCGGELYRSDEQSRAVVVSRWTDAEALADGNNWFDLGAERFCADDAKAWEFTVVPVE